jgi:hypothetical protein
MKLTHAVEHIWINIATGRGHKEGPQSAGHVLFLDLSAGCMHVSSE